MKYLFLLLIILFWFSWESPIAGQSAKLKFEHKKTTQHKMLGGQNGISSLF